MAGIDKTYTNSYQEYQEFKDWAKGRYVTFFNGYKGYISNYIYRWDEEDFTGGELPIMNTPTWVDAYLIQNCTIKFVVDRLKEVYNKEEFEHLKNHDLQSPPSEEHQQNRKLVVQLYNRSNFPIHNKPYGGGAWWVQTNLGTNMWYHEGTKTWTDWDFPYPFNTNTAHGFKSLKAVIKHLRKQYLPKGAEFIVSGRYIGETYIIKVK